MEKIHSDLSSGPNVSSISALKANLGLANMGVIPLGEGFRLTPKEIYEYGFDFSSLPTVLKKYMIGRDIVQRAEERYVIDFFGLSLEEATNKYPRLMQRIIDRVKPERDQNRRKIRRRNWWLFGENAATLRPAIFSVSRYIGTCQTSKHRAFIFLNKHTLPDQKIVAIGLSDAFYLGVLSSRSHIVFARKAGSWLGVGNDSTYNHSLCFHKFPFPACDEQQKAKIRELGEALDAHRKRQQAQHPDLTITDMYNVMEKLRANQPLNAKEKLTHERGLVSVLRQIHDELDAAVFAAYGWPASLTDEEILERLVALNRERAAEERNGLIRWLRPEFQNPQGTAQTALANTDAISTTIAAARQDKIVWPKTLPEQARAVRAALAEQKGVVSPEQLNEAFKGGKNRLERIAELLRTLASLGQAREVEAGRFAA